MAGIAALLSHDAERRPILIAGSNRHRTFMFGPVRTRGAELAGIVDEDMSKA